MSAASVRDLGRHLTARDLRILEDLEQYRLLTTRQLQRLHLPAQPFGTHTTPRSATRGTTRILGRLEELNAVARLERRIGGIEHGSALTIWQLGPAGLRHLRHLRGETTRKQYLEPGLAFTAHTLAVAEVSVVLREHSGAGHFELLELVAEPACWRPFTAAGGEVVTLKPDLLAVTADHDTETHSFIEVDLGTESVSVLIRKCRRYQQYARTGAEQIQRGLFPAVVWIVPTLKRADLLRQAITEDQMLDPDLFWIITPEQTLGQLAPYPTSATT
ncbi:replication-relaxation family protein [Agromyces aurantiacus]|uniref:Replication-relaxation family protein n=1 Tax=Agromyces aurantiacus TaxID=165814 RepID=A0ABV9R463_9MICO|nr:replication-relaxation family protein [Agromyces aurantiacus]MBM7502926.1 hypothetical protein [Agromyces aurantiacus]